MAISDEFSLVLKAIDFATKKHSGQTRKSSGVAYINHPLAVSYIFAKYKESRNIDKLIAACILHDTLEDTQTTHEELILEFGFFIANIVKEVTNNENDLERVGKIEYLTNKMCSLTSYALYIKLCDILCNLMDNPSEKQINTYKTIASNVLKNRTVLTKTQICMLQDIILFGVRNENN